jgi:uncharacterized protein YndB with AHSA1/START domain
MSSSAGAARAIADLSAGTILASVDIMVPPERVFGALSEAEEITRWWGHPDAYRTEKWTTDFRVGGHWRADGRSADGEPFHVAGEFLEIVSPHRIVQSWQPSWATGPATTVTYDLKAIPGGTRLLVRHDGFKDNEQACASHADGWILALGWLTDDIAPKPAPDTMKFYVARLLAPRPEFRQTLSAEEIAMMHRHIAYWRPLMAAGKVLALGPVDDPKGSWGLALMRVETEAELLALQAHDPAVLGGLTYENLPMARAVWRDDPLPPA